MIKNKMKNMADKELKILMLEDSPEDAELIQRELNQMLHSFKYLVVDNPADFSNALNRFQPNIILSDYSMPGFNGMVALKIAQEKCPDVPYIFVSGHIGEDHAIDALKMGATDYVLKDKLSKLIPSIQRALRDFEERQKRIYAEAALIESEKSFKGLFNSVTDAIYILDENARFLDINEGAVKMYGYNKEFVIGNYPEFLAAPNENNLVEFSEKIKKAASGHMQTLEFWGRKKNGEVFPQEIILNKGSYFGKPVVIAIARDITERKKYVDALKLSEEKYKTIYDASPLGIITVDPKSKILKFNKAMENISGYKEKELIGQNILDITHPDDKEVSNAFLQKVINEEIQSYNTQKRYITKNKKIIWVNLSASVVKDDNGNLLYTVGVIEDVTARKTAEESLQDTEKKLEAILDNLNLVIYSIDKSGIFTFSKGRGLESIGLNSGELVGRSLFDVFGSTPVYDNRNIQTDIYNSFTKVLKGENLSVTTQVGEIFYNNFLMPLYDLNNSVQGLIGVAVDITKEKELEVERIQLARFPNQNPNPVFKISEDGKILYSNKSSEVILNLWNKQDRDSLPEEWKKIISQVAASGETSRFEKREKDKYFNFTVIPFSEYKYLNIYGFDITYRKLTEEALRQSERKYKDIFEFAHHGIFQIDRNGKIITANPALVKILGYPSLEKLLQKNGTDLFWDEQHQEKINNEILKKGFVKNLEMQYKRWDNSPIWVQVNAHQVRNDSGNIIYYEGFVIDIDEKKKAEHALRESERRFKELAELLPQIIFEVDTVYDVKYLNKNGFEHLGYTEQDFISGINLLDIVDAKYHEKLIDAFYKTLQGIKIGGFEFYVRKKDGSVFPGLAYANPIIKDDKLAGLRGILIDNTERKRILKEIIDAKEKAEESDRLKSEFLAQMSHEIRTPLNVILSFSSLIQDELHDFNNEDWEKIFLSMNEAGRRLMRTIDLILDMAAIQTSKLEIINEKIDLVKLLGTLQHQLSTYADNKNIALNFNYVNNEMSFVSDRYIIMKIFENLIDNAIKYTFIGSVNINAFYDKDGKLIVEVKDTGIGISTEYMSKLFSPFTQEISGYSRPYEGNGLGLALVKKYVDALSAEIFIESEKGKGTTFTVAFKN